MTFPAPEDYRGNEDQGRLKKQLEAIKSLMLDGEWRTVTEVFEITGFPETSISSQFRHLRKPEYGAYRVERRRRKDAAGKAGVSEYRVLLPVSEVLQTDFFGHSQIDRAMG